MGSLKDFVSFAKKELQFNKFRADIDNRVEQTLSLFHIPSGNEIQVLHDRLDELDETLDAVEQAVKRVQEKLART